MADQTDYASARGGSPVPPSSSSSLSKSPSYPRMDQASQSIRHTKGPQTESAREAARAGEYILDVIRRKQSHYNRKSNLQGYFDRVDASKGIYTSTKAKKPAHHGSDANLSDGMPAAKSGTPAKKPTKTLAAASHGLNSFLSPAGASLALSKKDAPRFDRTGHLRPANKKFLPRGKPSYKFKRYHRRARLTVPVPTGKLVGEEAGPETQLEEVQAWIQERKHIKFDLLPDAEEYSFEGIDDDVRTEPFHLKNQGRKLVIGRDEETEVCAILPFDDKKIYPCRFLLRDVAKGTYTAIKDITQLRDSNDELYYPWEAFASSTREDAWAQLQALVGYVFLLCGEADVVFTTSAKNPGSLSTALTHIKETYAPNGRSRQLMSCSRLITSSRRASHCRNRE